jgi:hypothetical protein
MKPKRTAAVRRKARAKKRDVFAEVMEGMAALSQSRETAAVSLKRRAGMAKASDLAKISRRCAKGEPTKGDKPG